jgi:membrane protein
MHVLLAPGKPLAAWLERLADMQVVNRGMGLGAQAFTALIPLVIVYSAVVPLADSHSFSDRLIGRLKLSGSTAASVRQAFAPPNAVEHDVTVLGFALVVVSSVSLARSLQRVYELAYELPAAGVRGTPWHLLWIALIPIYITLRPLFASFGGTWWHVLGSLLLASAIWLVTPYVLLGRRMSWRALLPGAAFAAVGMTALATASLVYLPHSLTISAARYGTIGIAFAMLSWLVIAGYVLVACAAAGAVANVLLEQRT